MPFIKGHFDGTGIVLDEAPPATLEVGQAVRVVVDAPPSAAASAEMPPGPQPPARRSLAGFAKGMIVMRDDFDDPLDEFAEYR